MWTFKELSRSLFVLYLFFVLSHGIDYSYTKVGYVDIAGTKVHCINDCRQNLCIIDNSLQEHKCTTSEEPAPISYTYQKKTSEVFCLSRCGFNGKDDFWCYVTQSGTWDYCNGNYGAKWIRDQPFTLREGPCISDCVASQCTGTNCKYRCQHYWGSTDDCDPKERYDYIQANVQNGGQCSGRCFYHENETYLWCYYGTNRQWDRCVLPTLPPSISWRQRLADLTLPNTVQRFTPELILFNITMTQLISEIFYDYNLMIINLHYIETNPVYKFAHVNSKDGDQAPVLVRAAVKRSHLRDVTSDNNEFLIAEGLGGPRRSYNMVPKHRAVAASYFKREEQIIREFFSRQVDGELQVKIDVVVINQAHVERPIAFLVHTKYYLGEEIKQEYGDIVPNVDLSE